jgi:uncharacterized protein (DUF2236 family)
LSDLADAIRARVVASATSPFGHTDYPLADSLSHRGDPGLFGPGSPSWAVIGDAAAFVGGIRALLIQAAHPEVVAGVSDHSRYREDPLGRLSRTSAYVTATTFGAGPEVARAVSLVRRAHEPVRGRSHRNRPYAAGTPRFAAWVHNALTDSFLTAYRWYGPRPLTPSDADRFVAEQARIGRLLDADPTPETADALTAWVADHPDVGASPGMRETVAFLADPPLDRAQRAGYRLLYGAAVATIPPRIRLALGVEANRGAVPAGRAAVGFLRWALGSSPSWNLALVRVGAVIPAGLFRQPLPVPDPAQSEARVALHPEVASDDGG